MSFLSSRCALCKNCPQTHFSRKSPEPFSRYTCTFHHSTGLVPQTNSNPVKHWFLKVTGHAIHSQHSTTLSVLSEVLVSNWMDVGFGFFFKLSEVLVFVFQIFSIFFLKECGYWIGGEKSGWSMCYGLYCSILWRNYHRQDNF